jgi:hypothetical protein
MNWELKKRISEKYRNQWEFAQQIGTCETIVSKVVRGRMKVSPDQQKRWADALQCSPRDIFSVEG